MLSSIIRGHKVKHRENMFYIFSSLIATDGPSSPITPTTQWPHVMRQNSIIINYHSERSYTTPIRIEANNKPIGKCTLDLLELIMKKNPPTINRNRDVEELRVVACHDIRAKYINLSVDSYDLGPGYVPRLSLEQLRDLRKEAIETGNIPLDDFLNDNYVDYKMQNDMPAPKGCCMIQ